MRRLADINDADCDRLLARQKPEDSRLEGVVDFLRELDRAVPEMPTAASEATHVRAMVEASLSVAERARADEPAPRWRAVFSAGTRPRGRMVPRREFALQRWAAVVAVSFAAVAAFAGAAHAGVLPTQLQSATASLAQHVGIAIPVGRVVAVSSPKALRPLTVAATETGQSTAATTAHDAAASASDTHRSSSTKSHAAASTHAGSSATGDAGAGNATTSASSASGSGSSGGSTRARNAGGSSKHSRANKRSKAGIARHGHRGGGGRGGSREWGTIDGQDQQSQGMGDATTPSQGADGDQGSDASASGETGSASDGT